MAECVRTKTGSPGVAVDCYTTRPQDHSTFVLEVLHGPIWIRFAGSYRLAV